MSRYKNPSARLTSSPATNCKHEIVTRIFAFVRNFAVISGERTLWVPIFHLSIYQQEVVFVFTHDLLTSIILFLKDTFPSLVVNGVTTPAWVNVRETNNYDSQAPVRLNLISTNNTIDLKRAIITHLRSQMLLARISDAMIPRPVPSLKLSMSRPARNWASWVISQFITQEYVTISMNVVDNWTIWPLCYFQVVNVYMAKAPGNVTDWAGDGAVWFKVLLSFSTSMCFKIRIVFIGLWNHSRH